MKVVDFNDWNEEVEKILIYNHEYKKMKVLCIIIKWIGYISCFVSLIIFAQSFYNITNKEVLFYVCAIAFLVISYVKKYETRLKKCEIKNLVFCIIDEESFIDAKYIKETSKVMITFRDFVNETIEDFFVDCDVSIDDEIEEDTLIIHPNNAELILQTIGDDEEDVFYEGNEL